MMSRPLGKALSRLLLLLFLVIAGVPGCRPRSAAPERLAARFVAGGFASPVQIVSPPDRSGRLFVVDQVGVIWILAKGHQLDKPFLDLRDRVVQLLPFYDERGLLGLAFDPRFSTSGRFYVYYSAPRAEGLLPNGWDHTTHLSEFRVARDNPNEADPASERVLLAIDKPGYNYEGGGLAFGPDSYLYVGTGDSVRDPSTEAGGSAQDTYSLLGKILRLDVKMSGRYRIPPDNPFAAGGGRPEVLALGFRNPYRISFDASSQGAHLYVGDVGQALMEEVDLVTPGGNYGWPIREGTTCFNAKDWGRPLSACAHSQLVDPVLEYPHVGKASAIIGGSVYRGGALPALFGKYVFGDWGRGLEYLFAAWPPDSGAGPWSVQQIRVDVPDLPRAQLLGIGADANHELYVLAKDLGIGPVGSSGRVYKLEPP